MRAWTRWDSVRIGRFADPLQAILTIVGVAASAVHPLAIVAVAVPLGIVAPTVRRAFVLSLYLAGLAAVVAVLGLTVGTLGPADADPGWIVDATREFWLGVAAGGAALASVAARAVTGFLQKTTGDRGR